MKAQDKARAKANELRNVKEDKEMKEKVEAKRDLVVLQGKA